jgi:phthalate 4,5-cis-dihydrodiol dehydrogenase
VLPKHRLMTISATAPLRLAILGLGTAGRSLFPAIDGRDDVRLVAVADPLRAAREEVAERYGARAVADVEALAAMSDVDAVYIATPTDLHEQHVVALAASGKHVLCEKPMAIDLAGAARMNEATRKAGVIFQIGHSHSYDTPYTAMREIVASGRLGRVRLMNSMYYTDWMFRPRRPEELDHRLGGGVTFRQGAHQFDILRLIGGGMVKSVRAHTFDWMPDRAGIGAHTATLTFEDGTIATALYNGYGGFLSSEICFDAGELGGFVPVENAGKARREFASRAAGNELAAKRQRAAARAEDVAPMQPFFGWLMVSCEGGDIRQSATGLYVYTERGREEITLPLVGTRALVLKEFVEAISAGKAPLHDGRWGMANLEVAVATIVSSAENRDVFLEHQVPVTEHRA